MSAAYVCDRCGHLSARGEAAGWKRIAEAPAVDLCGSCAASFDRFMAGAAVVAQSRALGLLDGAGS